MEVLEQLALQDLRQVNLNLYGSAGDKIAYVEREINVQTGSNGFAIASKQQLKCHFIH
jgi:hypothetical protein